MVRRPRTQGANDNDALSAIPADPLADFLPPVQQWFASALGDPTEPQVLAWPAIRRGENALILSPTGSGKTLASFLACLDDLWRTLEAGEQPDGIHTLYISPLKALNADVHRNLEAPLEGVRQFAEAMGSPLPEIRAAVRTGDTTQAARQAMLRKPPHILITTPESIFILLTSEKGRKMLSAVKYVIMDEIHAIAGTKRGVHMALTLEQLAEHAGEFQRIGLSATQRPLEEIAKFLGGARWESGKLVPRPVSILDAGRRKNLDVAVISSVPDFTNLGEDSVWPALFANLLHLVKTHTSTLVFANNRRLAERVAAQLNRMLEGGEDRPERVIAQVDPGSMVAQAKPKMRESRAVKKTKAKGKGGTAPRRGPGEEVVASGNGPVRAHHGSMSKESRREMEEDLKAGRLPALIATSSLELGIDVGHVDLVVLLQSPKGVSRGLQRVGRAGHQVGETSKGRILPTHREDLVESAVTVRAMLDGEVEETRVPKGCLDILAQQVAAAVAAEPRNEDDLYRIITRAYPYWDLSRNLYDEVLEMLGGKYPAQAFRELKPRIHRDRARNMLTPLPGTRLLVMMNAGAIPDRGYYAAMHVDGKTKLGELDEEFVFESRVGDVFLLGSSAWRITSIDRDRVYVQEAPGEPARMPFWRGESMGRPYELGVRIGRFRREIEERIEDPDINTWLAERYMLDENSCANLVRYLKRQKDATGGLPTDKRIIIEMFRDEMGDPRLAIHSAFGGKVNGPWALALRKKLSDRLGIEIEALYNDDGILLRFPDAEAPPPFDVVTDLTASEGEQFVLDELPGSALFAAQFRQNAERALLLPRARGGKRTPFWLQRLRAADLLQVAQRFDSFPIILETFRDTVRDVLDLEHFREVLSNMDGGDIEVLPVETDAPSPFAASLLFDFIGVYMYEWDKPKGEHKTQMLRLNRELLEEVLGKGSLRELLREDAIDDVEASLQSLAPDSRARNDDEIAALLQRLGPLSESEIARRYTEDDAGPALARLQAGGRVIQVPLRRRTLTEWRYAAVEDAALLKRAHRDGADMRGPAKTLLSFIGARDGVADHDLADAPVDPKRVIGALDDLVRGWHVTRRGNDEDPEWHPFDPSLPAALRPPPHDAQDQVDARQEVVARTLRTRGPLSLTDLEDATALATEPIAGALRVLVEAKTVAQGEFRPGGASREWVDRQNFERIHRLTLALLRKEIEPVDLMQFQAHLLHHQHLHPKARKLGKGGLERVLRNLHGASIPGEAWERAILWGRVRGYEPSDVSALVANGEFLFTSNSRDKGAKSKFTVIARGEGRGFLDATPAEGLSDLATRIRDTLQREGALFARDLGVILDTDDEAALKALDELVRAGEVTNENFEVIRRMLRGEKIFTRSKGRRGLASEMRVSTPWGRPLPRPRVGGFPTRAIGGRWSLVKTASALGVDAPRPELAARVGRQLLDRYGVITRDLFDRESTPLLWNEIADALKHLEVVGEVRRGYFVKGLHGLQFAYPDTVEKLRERRAAAKRDSEYVLVNATDPACLFGTGIDHVLRDPLKQEVKWSRTPATSLVIADGRPVLLVEQHGKKLTTLEGTDDHDLRQAIRALAGLMDLPAAMRPRRALNVEAIDGKPVIYGKVGEILEEAGFIEESRKMVLYPSRRR